MTGNMEIEDAKIVTSLLNQMITNIEEYFGKNKGVCNEREGKR